KNINKADYANYEAQPNIPLIISKEDAENGLFCFTGEFGYELISWLPFVYFIKKKLNISINTLSRPGSKIFYYFSNNHIEVGSELIGDQWGEHAVYKKISELYPDKLLIHPGPDYINQRHIQIENFVWENRNIHSIIATNNYILPDFSFVNKAIPKEIKKPFVVLNNKFFRQWFQKYKAPLNYFDRAELLDMKEALNEMGYFVVYNHFVEKTASDQYFQLNDENLFGKDEKSYDLRKVYKSLKSVGDRNELQLSLFNQSEFVIGPQGGNLYLPALCRKNLWILMRDGIYLDYLEFGRIFDIEVNMFYEPVHIINSLKNLKSNPNRKIFTKKAIEKFYFAIVGKSRQITKAAEELLFSVCIFTYNRAKYLKEAINSVLSQSYENFELVIYDDGSTDNTSEVVRSFSSEKIRYFKKEHTNAPDTRNKAIAEAKGKYIIWLGSDDVILPDTLLHYSEILKEHPNIDILYGDLYICDENLKVSEELTYEDWKGRNRELLTNMLFSNSLPDGGSAIRKSLYQQYGNYSLDFPRAHDYKWFSQVVKFVNLKKANRFVYKWRWHSSNMSSGSVDIDFSYDVEVVKGIINNNSLQELFYFLNWDNPKRAKADAYLYLAKRFIHLKDYNIALDYLKQIYYLHPSPDIKASIEQFTKIVHKEAMRNSAWKSELENERTSEQADLSSFNALVSVIIPTIGKRPKELKRAIQSVLDQTYYNIEIIVVNDGGDEKLIDLINSIDAKGSNIVYLRNEKNIKLAATRNVGLKAAQGKYVCYLDDDDFFYPNHIETLLRALENSDYKIAYTDAYRAFQEKIGDEYITLKRDVPYSKDFDYDEILVGNFIPVLCVMHEKSCLDEVRGGFDENMHSHEDLELWLRLSRKFKFLHIKKITCEYVWRTDGSTMTSSQRENMLHSLEYIYEKYKEDVRFKPHLQKAREINLEYFRREIEELKRKQLLSKEAKQEEKAVQIEEEQGEEVLVSIIIPVLNNIQFTEKCIESIRNTCADLNYEIIVVDNGSTDGTRDLLYAEQIIGNGIVSIFNEEAKSFSQSNNQGAALAHGKYFVFLNNDTQVQAGWLHSIIDSFEKDEKLGVQGGKLLYPNDTIQHAGIVFGPVQKDMNIHFHIYLAYPKDFECVNKGRDFQMLTGAMLAIRRSVFKEINGFDENYYFGHEDLDLCLSAKKDGHKVRYNPKAVAYHFEAKTKQLEGIEKFERYYKNPESYDARNQKYFNEKWAGFLEIDADKYYREDGFYALLSNEEEKQQFQKRLLLLSEKVNEIIDKKNFAMLIKVISIIKNKPEEEIDINKDLQFESIPEERLIKAETLLSISQQNGVEKMEKMNSNKNKLKVLFTMFGWNESGGGTTLPRSEALLLAQKNVDIAVFYAAGKHGTSDQPYYFEQSEEKGVKLFAVFNRPTSFLDETNPAREIKDENICKHFETVLESFRPDIVHFQNFLGLSFEIAKIAKQKGIKCVYTPHNYHLIDPRLYLFNSDLSLWKNVDFFQNSELIQKYPHLEKDYRKRAELTKSLLRETIDCTFAVSGRMKELLSAHCGSSEKICVVNQIPHSTADLPAIQKDSEQIEFPIRVSFIGGAMAHKGVHIIAEAAQSLDKEKIAFDVWGFIDESYKRLLIDIDKKQMLNFKGNYVVDDLLKISASSDLAIIPSVWEDCAPLVLAESLALKLPVIASKIGGVQDFIRDGYNGFLYKHDSPAELSQILQKIIDNPNIIIELRNNCFLPYSFDDFIDHLIHIYQIIISKDGCSCEEIEKRFFSSTESNKVELKQKKLMEQTISSAAMNRMQFEKDIYGGFSNKLARGVLPSPLPSPLLLNLGCGKDVREGFLNIDLFSEDPSVIGMDIRQLEFADNSVDGILASDILEHFSHRQTDAILKEWARVLKPNAEIIIRCPSLRLQVKAYYNGVWDADVASYMIFGGQTNPGDYHCLAFDEQSIKKHLEMAGFEVLSFEEIDTPQDRGFINLNFTVKARKKQASVSEQKNEISDGKFDIFFDSPPKSYFAKEEEIEATEEDLFKEKVISQESLFDDLEKKEEQVFDYSDLENLIEKKPELNIVWEGSQFVYHSLALINREHCANIIDTGLAELTIIPYENDQFSPAGNEKYEKLLKHDIRYKKKTKDEISDLPYVWIRHQWPPNFERPLGAKWIINQPWEYTQLRADFAEGFKKADEIWTPSNYSRQCFLNSGIDFNKVQVIPNGIDPTLFKPDGRKNAVNSNKKLKLIFLGGTIFRKGIDILLNAYTKTFSNLDNISLVIKDMGGDSFYQGQTAKEFIQDIQKKPNSPEIIYIEEYLTEQDIVELYHSCDVFVCPYRGEGFSLPTLEAMACGLPVVVTEGGATDDFVLDDFAWRIPATKLSIGDKMGNQKLTGEAFVLEADEKELAATLKYIYENPSMIKSRGLIASKTARTLWTWNRATVKMFSRLDALFNIKLAEKVERTLKDKEDAYIWLGEAENLLMEEKDEKALDLFIKAYKSNQLENTYLSHCLNRITNTLLIMDESKEAEKYFEIAEKDFAHNIDFKFNKAFYHHTKEETTEALEILSDLLDRWKEEKYTSSLEINLEDLLLLTGECFLDDEDSDAAIQIYTETLKLYQDSYLACYGAARAFLISDIKDEAKNMLEWSLKLNPDFEEAKILLEEIS
ncbi:MAG: glycosyltransferase, partial [Ignavibacteria bacterium]|nr:glycosyltransferase [Ignavibacteria bacterium]